MSECRTSASQILAPRLMPVKQFHRSVPLPSSPLLIETSATRSGRVFDAAAQRYDSDAAANLMMRWLRHESLKALMPTFPPGSQVLEVGCGTGEEAVALARLGITVVATDASAGMLRVAQDKARANGIEHLLTLRLLPAEQLGDLYAEYGGNFDGAYSSLGALNLANDLPQVAHSLGRLTKPGAPMVLSLLNRFCLWETLWFARARKRKQAVRRWRGEARGTALPGGDTVPVRYWSPGEVRRVFAPAFSVVECRSLPWALPPTYASHVVERHPALYKYLKVLEHHTSHLAPFSGLGDHTLFIMRRHGTSPTLSETD